jgi:hypothetical protein
MHDLGALRERRVVGGDQGDVPAVTTGQPPCALEVAAERVRRRVTEARKPRGQVLIGGKGGPVCSPLGDERVAVEREADGAAQPRVANGARGVERQVLHDRPRAGEEALAGDSARGSVARP